MAKRDSPEQTLREYLDASDWQAKKIPERSAFKATREGEDYPTTYYFQLVDDLDQFLFYIAPDIDLLPDQLPAVAEYIARANFGMRIGNFELDMKEGRISFRSGVNFRGVGLSRALIDGTIQPALKAFEEFYPSLEKVIAGIKTPVEAINEAEYGT